MEVCGRFVGGCGSLWAAHRRIWEACERLWEAYGQCGQFVTTHNLED